MSSSTYSTDTTPTTATILERINDSLQVNAGFVYIAILGILGILLVCMFYMCIKQSCRKRKKKTKRPRQTESEQHEETNNIGLSMHEDVQIPDLPDEPVQMSTSNPNKSQPATSRLHRQNIELPLRPHPTNFSAPTLPPGTSQEDLDQSVDKAVPARPRSGTHPGADPYMRRSSLAQPESFDEEEVSIKVHSETRKSARSKKGVTGSRKNQDDIVYSSVDDLLMADRQAIYGNIGCTGPTRGVLLSTASSMSGKQSTGSGNLSGGGYKSASNQDMLFQGVGNRTEMFPQTLDHKSVGLPRRAENRKGNLEKAREEGNSTCSIYGNVTIAMPNAPKKNSDETMGTIGQVSQRSETASKYEGIMKSVDDIEDVDETNEEDLYENLSFKTLTTSNKDNMLNDSALSPKHKYASPNTDSTPDDADSIIDDIIGSMSFGYDRLHRAPYERRLCVAVLDQKPAKPTVVTMDESTYEIPWALSRKSSSSSSSSSISQPHVQHKNCKMSSKVSLDDIMDDLQRQFDD